MRLVCIIIALLIFNVAQARQTDFNYVGFSEIGLSSPTASGLGEYASVPVSMSTGIPSISIPITTITAGDIQVPVSLSYHSAGIKVTEYPGEVGLGWSLNAGGVITRVVKGYQDELNETFYEGYFEWAERINNPLDSTWYTNGQYDVNKFNSFLRRVAKNEIDAEPDVYFYNFGGYSGLFVLDGQGDFVTFPDANFGIEYPVIDTKGVYEFIITTEDGKKYKFAKREYSHRVTIPDENPNPLFPDLRAYPSGTSRNHATAWYLTEISSPHHIQKVNFQYTTEVPTLDNTVTSIGSSTVVNKLVGPGTNQACTDDSWSISTSRSLSKVEGYVRLNRIYVSNGNDMEVNISYTDSTIYAPLEYKVDKISVKNANGTEYKSFQMGYGNDTGSEQLLLLTSVQETASDGRTIPPYKFTYNLGINQPRESIHRDYLGYPRPSRGGTVNHLIGAVTAGDGDTGIGATRAPDFNYTKAGVLKKIEYPTGGFSEFDYELNEAMVDGISTDVGGLRIKKITSNALDPESPVLVKTYEYGEGDVTGYEGVLSRGAFFDTNRIYSVINGENCYQEIGVADPQTPLFGHFIQYDYVREIIDYGNGGARTEVYDTILDGTNGSTYFGGGSDGVTYRRALPLESFTEIKADSSNPEMNTPEYLRMFETKNEYNIYTGGSVGGYFSDIQSLLWRRPDFQLKNIVTAQGTTVDTTYAFDSGLYKRMWAYKTKETNTNYQYKWVQKDTVIVDGSTLIPMDLSEYKTVGEISSITEYEYKNSVHKQITKKTETNSDGTKLITNYKYAHIDFDTALVDSNDFTPMLINAPYSIIREDASGKDLGGSWVTWSNFGGLSLNEWNPYQLFVWDDDSTNAVHANFSEAEKKIEVNSYDQYGNPLEVTNSLNVKTKFYYGSNTQPFSQNGLSGVNGTFLTGIQKQNGAAIEAISGGVRPTSGDDFYTEARYDTRGRLSTIIGENDSESKFHYDAFNRLSATYNSQYGLSTNDYFYSLDANSSYAASSPNYVKSSIYDVAYATDFSSSTGWSSVDSFNAFNISAYGETTVRMGGDGNYKTMYKTIGEEDLVARIDFYPDNSTGGTPHVYLDSNGHRFGLNYLPGSDRFRIQYRMSSGAFQYPFTFPLNAPPNRWYTIEFQKVDGEITAWVYYREEGRDSDNMFKQVGFVASWQPQFRLSTNDNYFYAANLSVSKPSTSSITYLDGLGRQLQSQQVGVNESIIAGTLYDTRGNSPVASRPISQTGTSGYVQNLFRGSGSFTPGNALPSSSPIENYYDPFFSGEEDYAYNYTQSEPMPGGRTTSSRMPGGINYSSSSSYEITKNINHADSLEYFENYALNKSMAKTTLSNPDSNTSITYSDGWGKTIASGVDMNGDGKLDGKNKTTCSGSTCDIITQFEYDERSNLVKVTDPDGLETTYTYNELGQLIQKDTPDQDSPTDYIYDKHGNLRFVENATHKQAGSNISLTLTHSGSDFTRDIDPNTTGQLTFDVSIATQYDDFDVWVADDAHADEKLISDVAPFDDGWETTANKTFVVNKGNYKVIGQAQNQGDGWETSSGTIDFKPFKYSYTKYDNLNRPIEVGEYYGASNPNKTNADNTSFPTADRTKLIEYKYDEDDAYSTARNLQGRLAQVWYYDINDLSISGRTYYSYNDLGLVEWIVQDLPGTFSSKTIRYTYDENGRLTRMHFDGTSNDHYFWYSYDHLGRLEKIKSHGTANESSALTEVEFTYFADGTVDQVILGGGAQTLDYSYTIQGWVEKINDPSSMGQDVFGAVLDYSNAGNVTRQRWEHSSLGSSEYNYHYFYDNANRLEKACYDTVNCSNTDFFVDYQYHRNGRLDWLKRYGGSGSLDDDLNHNYLSNKNILDNVSAFQFSNDPMGNLTENQVQGIDNTSYDWRNLPNWLVADGSALLYTYDAEGKRVKKELVDGLTTYYIRGADGQTVAAYDGSGNLLFINILSGGQIIGQIEN